MSKIRLNFKPRQQQLEILEFVKNSFNNKKKFVLIDAPTGIGKSYASIMISDWYIKNINFNAKIDILTNSKILQDQYIKDFNFISNLKGKNNYWCNKNKMTCGESQILNKAINDKNNCKYCSYKIAKSNFLKSEISLTNFHLITSFSMYSEDILNERKSNLLIIDEAHLFEEVFSEFISSSFSERSLKLLDIYTPIIENELNSISNIYELCNYVKNIIIPSLNNKINDLFYEISNNRNIRKNKKIDIIRKIDIIDKTICKYYRFIDDEKNFENNWIFDKNLDDYGKIKINIEPIWANSYLKKYFWNKYDHVIFMSGTILDKNLFSFLMGIDENESEYLSLPCPFNAEKRPIIYLKFGKMSYSEKENSLKISIDIIKRILDRNKNYKGIIHTSNYEFSNWIKSSIQDNRLLFHNSYNREEFLDLHINSEYETVLVSPSMINGIDLKDDLSRFQIILKVPFPNLASKKVKKRLEINPDWYYWKTTVDILQAYGRSIRNEEDWAETYILDECFDQILKNRFVPKYFLDSLKIKKLK